MVYFGMRGTIDKADRVVIPKALRDQLGLRAGEIEINIHGSGVQIEPVVDDNLIKEGNLLVTKASGTPIDNQLVSVLRLSNQK
ncbi:MAG: AbrB/MazE/SpoVT family DNA-binding domain-containing protein [Acidimicrobiales bacterium]|nr:AbrB/MazE/SpoVT family DNA-binding domain-containing protein [Acidimicrobiales bacterium]